MCHGRNLCASWSLVLTHLQREFEHVGVALGLDEDERAAGVAREEVAEHLRLHIVLDVHHHLGHR